MQGDLTFFQGFLLSIGGGEAPAVEDPAGANDSWLPPDGRRPKTAGQEIAVAAAASEAKSATVRQAKWSKTR
ncbi:MAG: hypothetical protein QGH37_30385 [Candidatus Poribacteria bacterium]|nr:hypothetical protein [Candidatus Poribacteria bacterium]